jgi:hypothetical protein
VTSVVPQLTHRLSTARLIHCHHVGYYQNLTCSLSFRTDASLFLPHVGGLDEDTFRTTSRQEHYSQRPASYWCHHPSESSIALEYHAKMLNRCCRACQGQTPCPPFLGRKFDYALLVAVLLLCIVNTAQGFFSADIGCKSKVQSVGLGRFTKTKRLASEDDEVIEEPDFGEEDLQTAGAVIDDLNWRVEKLRLEEANKRRFLKAKPRFLPYKDASNWVQAWGQRWTSAEDWYVTRRRQSHQ